MEGVLVSVKRTGSTMTTTVVSDQQGRFRFPHSRLEPGPYAVRIRAVGYDLESAVTAEVDAQKTTTTDLKLQKARDLASQLSNAEWLASFPGTEAQKTSIRPCTHCHTLERIVRTRYDADRMVSAIERMSTYPQLSFPLKIQKLPAPRIGGGPDSPEQRRAAWRRQAEYLATLHLSTGPQWGYPLRTLPRPKRKATQVIYTEYDLPQRTRQPHDVIVDSTGLAWYASFGEQILGKLDPRTGKIVEYPVPLLKPNAPTGILGVRFDKDENLWLGMQFQGGIAKFDRKTETFQTWSLPPELNGPHVQINQVSPDRSYVDGKVWLQDAGTYTVLRLDLASGKFDVFEPYKIPRPNVYDVIPDSRNNGHFLVLGAEDVGRINAKTGEITIFKTPTARSGPRRGMMDSQDRLWFGENNGDRIGMFDTRTERFQEWAAPTPGTWPYDVTADKDGNVWSGGEYTDRIARLNPATGQFVEYLLPRPTNVRRVFVDNSTTPATFWVGNNHGASIVRLEPLDAPAVPTQAPAPERTSSYWSQEYWAQKGDVKLSLFRKRRDAPIPGARALPVLFLVHGSSNSGRSSFDLDVPGRGDYSMMNVFADHGFDVWTMDFEGYGRSTRTAGNSNIAEGVKDLEAATDVVIRETRQPRMHFFGESSGGLRAGAFAMAHPDRVDRLVLAAFTYTGEGSPTLAERAKQLEFYRTHNRRPRDRAMIRSIFTRDQPGTADPAVADALADAELVFGDSVPTGTYLDMTANLPVVDPTKVHAPVLLVRGEYDGIATEEDLVNFFRKLANRDKQLVVLPGTSHAVAFGYNRDQLWRVMRSFLDMPPRRDHVGQ
jgi:streptogramin lyase/alpha-beta hydrolase superfamily lysophospholipase